MTSEKTTPKKLIKILSLDGGGIRGLISAMILNALANKLKNKNLTKHFDVMAGTSTGGIIALLLNTPNANKQPKFTTQDVVDIYKHFGPVVFNHSLRHNLKTFYGWFGVKYPEQAFEKNLKEYFGNTVLSDALTNVLIPAYDTATDKTIFFKTKKAREYLSRDFYFRDIARATSAAPTYFKSAIIQDLAGKNVYNLIDGGVSVNNPTLSATIHGLKLYKECHDFLILSIGTGTTYGASKEKLFKRQKNLNAGGLLAWSTKIVPIVMNAGNDVVDYQMQEVFLQPEGRNYNRFQINIDLKHSDFDNTKKSNLLALAKYGEAIMQSHDKVLSSIAKILNEDLIE